MTVYNLGSINIDNIYRVPHLVQPGETLAASEFSQGLGGKGANMSVAVARAAARVVHIGAVGQDGRWAVERMMEYGVDTRHIATVGHATGHANICVDAQGENSIVLLHGANHQISEDAITAALAPASSGDTLLMQNETNGHAHAVSLAKEKGLRIAYAAAPFDAQAIQRIADHVDLLVLNQVEAEQFAQETGSNLDDLGISDIVVTLGADGCRWTSKTHQSEKTLPAFATKVVDTTGAGDTFTGFLVAGLDRGMPMEQALNLGLRAAAIMVSRVGTADVIPDLKDIEDHRFA